VTSREKEQKNPFRTMQKTLAVFDWI